jgi:hypothetical protein
MITTVTMDKTVAGYSIPVVALVSFPPDNHNLLL